MILHNVVVSKEKELFFVSNREVYYSKGHHWDDHDDFDTFETDKNINIAKVVKSGNSCVKVKVDSELEAEFEDNDDDDDKKDNRRRRRRKCR